jgi:hypothetical protein
VEDYRFPTWLYDKVLYVEKQGLWPVFQDAGLAERYDMAIVAGEGYATEACRVLFANAEKGKNYQLFVLHDADPYGYNIGRTLREATRRMPGHRIEVIDLGLRLEDALDMNLSTENFTRRKALPQGLQLSDLEREYFTGRPAGNKAWVARRVELNALSAPNLIAYTERKLAEAGVRGKVKPSAATLPSLVEGIYCDVLYPKIDAALAQVLGVDAIKAHLADNLRKRVRLNQASKWIDQAFKDDDSLSWREAVGRKVAEILRDRNSDLEAAVRKAVVETLSRS